MAWGAFNCSEAVSTIHAQYLKPGEQVGASALDELLRDDLIASLSLQNAYVPAYIIARFELDPAMPEKVREAVLAEFRNPQSGLLSASDLEALDAAIAKKLEDPALKARLSGNLRSAREEFETARDRRAGRSRTLNLVRTLKTFRRLLDEEFSFANLDAGLYGFHGFHMDRDAAGAIPRVYVQRPWKQVSPKGLDPADIVDIRQQEYADVALFAKEIEDPILTYSGESGNMLQAILPKLGRFMGKTEEQMRYAYEANPKNPKWCESPWCEEEKRHGPFLGKIYERITGQTSETENPHEGTVEMSTVENAIEHLYSRQANEWAASSAYVYLAGHSREGSVLRDYVMNIARDEFKHLAIVSGAYAYLFGPQLNKRMLGMIRVTLNLLKIHRANRTTADGIFGHPLSKLEVLMVYAMMERKVREWVTTLPYKTLKIVFDGPSLAPVLPAAAMTPDALKRLIEQQANGKRIRDLREFWNGKDRMAVLDQEFYEQAHAAGIDRIIREEFGSFAGMEDPASAAAKEALKRIDSYRTRAFDVKMMRKILRDNLRHHQIMNNSIKRGLDASNGVARFGGRQTP